MVNLIFQVLISLYEVQSIGKFKYHTGTYDLALLVRYLKNEHGNK